MDIGSREPAGHASIKVAILYKIFAQNPKMWRNAPKWRVVPEDFYDS